jgi:hypothetical protein
MIKAKSIQLGIGTDMLAGKHSVTASKGSELIVSSAGVVAVSHKGKRIVHVPYANIRGIELSYNADLSQPPYCVPDWVQITTQEDAPKLNLGPIPASNVVRRPGRQSIQK